MPFRNLRKPRSKGSFAFPNTAALFNAPHHPYSQALLSAAPVPDPERKRARIVLHGDVPGPANAPPGCHFHPRCPIAAAVCRTTRPPLVLVAPGHAAAGHFAAPFPIPSTV